MPAPAAAAPPPNDSAAGAGVFSSYTAAGGRPRQQQAIAELAEATPDGQVPRCLGSSSFARTVWYRLPEAPTPQEVNVDASGTTLEVLDLAAFVQPPVTPTAAAPLTRGPNVCDGKGAGGSDAAEEPTSAVTLLVPAFRPVLFQVGRRGPVSSPDAERALVTLETRARTLPGPPRGDQAGSVTPRLGSSRDSFVDLAGATITEDDPAEPPCPSLGTVWRRFEPGSTGKRKTTVAGADATTLTVFSGHRPTGDDALDCVNREGFGSLQMVVPARRGRTLWIGIGTGRTGVGDGATVTVEPGEKATVIDGGPGGSDPTPYGPGGGLPAACDSADGADATITGPALAGRAGDRNRFQRVPVAIRVSGSSVCDADLRLRGPGGQVYARGQAIRLAPGRRRVGLPRLRTFVPGADHLEVIGLDKLGKHARVRTRVRGRLRR
ncbi:MAG: hypothetical protein ACR2NB_05505 [Solirubrobacteraceae bacterium]